MRALLGFALLPIAGLANAQALLPSFEFKGIRASDTQSQHVALFKKCAKYLNFNGCRFLDARVGGKLAFPEAGWAFDGSLVLIRGEVSSYDYSTIREAFELKWGAPTTSVESLVQNGYGATLNVPTSVWKFREGEMTLTGPSFKEGGAFHFWSNAYKAYMDGLDKPKADF